MHVWHRYVGQAWERQGCIGLGIVIYWEYAHVQLSLVVSQTQSTTSSITSSKLRVPQVNPMIRPAHDPEKQGARAKPSGDLVSCDQISNRSPDPSCVLSRDKSRDSIRFG